MPLEIKKLRFKIFDLAPLIILFIISLNGLSTFDIKYFSVNINYIIVYYWVLRQPQALGYGYIFIAGIITDVVFALPIGANALTLLILASAASYVRVVTVRISLLNDWLSFIPALLFANFVYFLIIYFSGYSIEYLYLFKNSIFTFIFYPVLWAGFTVLLNLMRS